ncbi:MAG: ribosomal protein S18-alanine N-acetyltransferase [bacterium]|nr:ribosomal protein S18-alanine N-acetyltransferase [bacterium]
MAIRIRKTRSRDIDDVYGIEQEQFPNPWKKDFLYSELTHDIARFYVAEDTDNLQIAGYIIFWVIGETVELHDIAVGETYKKQGIGTRLLGFLLETIGNEKVRVEEVFLEVRKSNDAAVAFYEKAGFKKIGERKNYYPNPVEDALLYVLNPGEEEEKL